MITKRSSVSALLLSIFTCGIYGYYWEYKAHDELKNASGEQGGFEPIVILLLSIFFYNIGWLLFGLDVAKKLSAIKAQRNIFSEDKTALYCILGFFIPVVLIYMVQEEMNALAD